MATGPGAVVPLRAGTTARPQPLLSLRGLAKRREGERAFEVGLAAFDLWPGEFCALVGPSGSGKSTLLDMIGLVLKPSRVDRFRLRVDGTDSPADVGELWWKPGGEDRLAAIRRNAMGYVLQSGGLFPFLSVGENIDLPRRMVDGRIDRRQTEKDMRQFGLGWGYEKKVATLSGGERQRVAILRALAHRPGVVLADEPTAAVDRSRAREVVGALRQYARELGAAVIMVTHDHALVEASADRWITLQPDPDLPAGVSGYRGVEGRGGGS